MLADLQARVPQAWQVFWQKLAKVQRKKCWKGVQLLHDTILLLITLEEGCIYQIKVIGDKCKVLQVHSK